MKDHPAVLPDSSSSSPLLAKLGLLSRAVGTATASKAMAVQAFGQVGVAP